MTALLILVEGVTLKLNAYFVEKTAKISLKLAQTDSFILRVAKKGSEILPILLFFKIKKVF